MVIVGAFLSPPYCCEPGRKRHFQPPNTEKSISADLLEALPHYVSIGSSVCENAKFAPY